jgi:hypothetical protein
MNRDRFTHGEGASAFVGALFDEGAPAARQVMQKLEISLTFATSGI